MRILTLAQLEAAGACDDQRALFEKTFGLSVEITEALCLEHAASFRWEWASAHLLSPAAWAEYDRACTAAMAEYNRVRSPAWAEYDRMRAAVLAEYDRMRAAAWARAYIGDTAA